VIAGFAIGFVIGFVFSMPPLGPTYFAIIERGLKKELNNAVAIGVGAGFMDLIYILIAYGGVSAIASILPVSVDNFFTANEETLKFYLGILGCIVIIFYGYKIMKSGKELNLPGDNSAAKKGTKEVFSKKIEKADIVLRRTEEGLGKLFHTKSQLNIHSDITGSFFIGVLMCLSSPTIGASWFATVGYLKSYGMISSSFSTGLLLSIGVLIGTSFWFYLMTKLIFKYSKKLSPDFLKKLNFSTGIFLILLGVIFLVKIISS